MQTFQDFILEILEFSAYAAEGDVNIVYETTASNAGTMYVMWEDTFYLVAQAAYQFNAGHNILTFTGTNPGDEVSFLFKVTDTDELEKMLATWKDLLAKAAAE